MFGGKLVISSRKEVPNSLRMESYQDVWQESIDIEYDGELSPDVCQSIAKAFESSKFCAKEQSGYGCLRWGDRDRVVGVDVEKRQLIIRCAVNLCD